MARKSLNFKVGIFVLAGLFLAVGGILWLGALQYFKGARTFVTYFDESVQGLQKDSIVKYRGVDVGRVVAIRVAPDSRLIEVVVQVRVDVDPTRDMVAQLKSVGITGITIVELNRRDPEAPDLSPSISFAAEHPVIPSRPSEIAQILGLIERVARQLSNVDFQGMAKSLHSTLKAMERVSSHKYLGQTVLEIQAAAKTINLAANRLDAILASGRVQSAVANADEAVKEVRQAAKEAKGLLKLANRELRAFKLAQTGERARRLMGNLEAGTMRTLESVRATIENLRRASASMERLLRRLESSPSDAIFSSPPPERKPDEQPKAP